MANEYLTRNPTSSGNQKVWTWAGWVKISNPNADIGLFGSYFDGGSRYTYFRLNSSYLTFFGGNYTIGSSTTYNSWIDVIEKNRDASGWMHIMVVYNTTNSSEDERVKIYINGINLDLTRNTSPTINSSTYINAKHPHYLGAWYSGSQFTEGELSDVFLVDGQALTPDVFGFYKDGDGYVSAGSTQATDFRPGQWSPRLPRSIKYTINRSGGFGVNGYYLPMNDSSNPGADFHCAPNSIIKLKGEDLPQPQNGAPTTSDAFVSQLRQETGTLGFDGVVKFDGASDWLQIPDSNDFDMGTGDFTLETYVLSENNSNYQGIFGSYDYDNAAVLLQLDNQGRLRFVAPTNIDQTGTTSVWNNEWHHIAMVKTGSTLKGFVDGKQEISVSYTSSINWGHSNNAITIGVVDRTNFPGQYDFKGYLSNLRLTKGTALYTSDFTPPTGPLTVLTNTKLLCCQSSTDATAATVIPTGAITANNNVFATTSELTGSIVLAVPGILDDTNNLITNGSFDSNTNGWTVNGAGAAAIVSSGQAQMTNGGTNVSSLDQTITTVVGHSYLVTALITPQGGGPMPRLYAQGSFGQVASNANVQQFVSVIRTATSTSTIISINSNTNVNNAVTLFDDVKVFDLNPVDYSADIKGSGSNKTLTPDGDAGVGYELGNYYGSAMTFDGSGDYFEITESNNEYDFDGDYTIEFWVNLNTINNVNDIIGTANNSVYLGSGKSGWIIGYASINNIGFRIGYQSNSSWVFEHHTNITTSTNQWNHIAITRSGSTQQFIINGVVVRADTQSNTITSTDNVLRVGGGFGSTSGLLNGQIQDLRIYKGVAKYKGGFDVPKPYTPVGIEAFRTTTDTCKNNFATLNGVDYRSSTTALSDGNLTMNATSNNGFVTSATLNIPNSGKYYFEFYEKVIDITTTNYIAIVSTVDSSISQQYRGYGYIYTDSVQATGFTTIDEGDLVGVAVDADNGTVSFYNNGTLVSTVTSSNVNNVRNSRIASYLPRGAGSYPPGDTRVFNFGQNPSFSGTTTAGTNADDSGKGLFKYAPPTGFLALCVDNLPAPAIADPGEHFKSVLYKNSQKISSVGFKPDLVWTKSRNQLYSHYLYDSVRGVGGIGLISDEPDPEGTYDAGGILSFDDDGFTLSTDAGLAETEAVAWCWKAGGAAVTNNDGSITSQVSANQTAGFSIISYTGNLAANQSIGHGLGKKPGMIIAKERTGFSGWSVYHKSRGNTKVSYLNGNESEYTENDSTSSWALTDPTSSVFYVGANGATNDTKPYIAYCWAEIEGFSKFGSYVGNSSDDGTFVYCGFKPAWVMIKVITTGTTNNWYIHDSSRNSTNPSNEYLMANENSDATVADHPLDMVSNGFKLRNGSYDGYNNSSYTYIFAAFAESPFQTANAR